MAGKGKKRSRHGSGTIAKRSDGRYAAAFTYPYYDAKTGRMKRHRAQTTKPDWESAEAWLVALKSDVLRGREVAPDDPRLSEYLCEWLADTVEPSVAPKTYAKREYHVRNHIIPALGPARIKELQPRQIHGLYVDMQRNGYSISTRRDVHGTLNMALSQAVRWGMISRSPLDLVEPPKARTGDASGEEPHDDEIRALTDGQARALFAATRGQRWSHYYAAAIRAGLRPGEMLGLQWGDLSLSADPASLRVRRALSAKPGTSKEGGGAYMKSPKSPASRRTLVLHWEAVDAFLAQRDMLRSEGLSVGDRSLVFPNTLGRPMNAHNLRNRHLRPALAAAGLPPLTLHELRHTFASIMLYEWRVGIEVVSKMLGHARVSYTLDIYGHLAPDAQAQAIQALQALQRRPKTGS